MPPPDTPTNPPVQPRQVPPGTATAPPATTAVPQAYRAKSVIGSRVNVQGDLSVGIVDDIVFNDQGTVEYMIVIQDNRLVTVPWQAAKFNFERRIATVNIAPEAYRRIPTYTVTTYPNYFAPTYRSEILRYYGLSPIENRHIDRRP